MRTIQILTLVAGLSFPAAYATNVDFFATGTFENGSTLTGTITIDTAAGDVVSGDLQVSGIAAHYTTFFGQLVWPPSSPFLYEAVFTNGQTTNNLLTLLFPPDFLTGYTGGPLCGLSPAVCQDQTLTYRSNIGTLDSLGSVSNFIALEAGSLTSSAAPEPSTCVMILAAALMVGAGRHKARLTRNKAKTGGGQPG